jgi:hypothetical protein
VLDQIAAARAVPASIGQKLAHTSSWWYRGQICDARFLPVLSSLVSTSWA